MGGEVSGSGILRPSLYWALTLYFVALSQLSVLHLESGKMSSLQQQLLAKVTCSLFVHNILLIVELRIKNLCIYLLLSLLL